MFPVVTCQLLAVVVIVVVDVATAVVAAIAATVAIFLQDERGRLRASEKNPNHCSLCHADRKI